MTALNKLQEKKIVAILRGIPGRDVPAVAEALLKGGITVLEVTLNSEGALAAIEELCARFKGELLVGAGTVLTPEEAADSVRAGAEFIISPNTHQQTIKKTKDLGALSIPGAFTATEVVQAFRWGGDIIKIFPATSAAYIKNLRGPLSHIPMMPTGGITVENIQEFASTGAVAFGIGSNLVNAGHAINEAYLNKLTAKAITFSNAITKLKSF
jgi:2-dehydro-3-deoxyphosphogluconate aldolase / (4S)-4-hydroxy-2-oxoglutarate aldolase